MDDEPKCYFGNNSTVAEETQESKKLTTRTKRTSATYIARNNERTGRSVQELSSKINEATFFFRSLTQVFMQNYEFDMYR